MHSWAKGHTTEPAKGSAADTEQQTAAHGVSVAYLLGRSITISTWQPPPKKASGRKSFTPLRAEPCSGVPSPASAVCTVENAAPVYTLLAMACGAFTGKTALSAAHIHYSLIKMVLCLLLLLLEKHFAFAGRRQAGSWPFTDLWDACGPRVTQVLPPVLPLQHLRQPDLHYGSGWRFSLCIGLHPALSPVQEEPESVHKSRWR